MSSGKGDGAGSSLRRVVTPERRYMPTPQQQDHDMSALLSTIQSSYAHACARLPVHHAGSICVGLLDPVSNIVANTLLSDEVAPVDDTELLARRSLDGLVAFLLYFFPSLADWDAVHHLLLADADLLVAVRLIVASRGMTVFSITSAASAKAFQPALRLAAQVAGHPQPEQLVRVWMSLSTRLHQAVDLLSATQPNLHDIQTLLTADDEPSAPDLEQTWSLAASRAAAYNTITNLLYPNTFTLMVVLLDTIRGFYLQALARLPTGELRTLYHQVIVNAGHCYGPMDPISNIILNTVWYDAAFPAAAAPPVLDMIGPHILTRIESRSMYGLISFLQSRYHHLSEHEIVQCLVAYRGDLSLAANEAMVTPCASVQEAYEAAATAAWHPNPEAQAAFLTSCKAKLQESPAAMALLQQDGNRVLSPEDVRYLAGVLLAEQKPSPQPVRKRSTWPVCDGKMRSMAEERRISRNVKATLNQHFLRDGEPMYKLHVICGANNSVCGPDYCTKEDNLSFAPCEYRYTHVNFLAVEKSGSSSSPVLFFAEFDNKKAEDESPVLCCKVDMPLPCAEHVRCLYCEVEGSKVVHPALEKFHGGDREFEEVIREEHSFTNDEIISYTKYALHRLCGHDEDFMYVNSSWSLAASRQAYHNIAAAPCHHTSSLMRVLLHAFRGFYLRALARLPAGELRNRYHQVIIKAGHCYGPMDPGSNIILNTVWYDAAFPAAARSPVLDMIGPHILTRIESRSMYGLISFMQSRYHHLSEHDILQCLVTHCGDMSLADPNLAANEAMVIKAEQQSPCASVQEAYEAAATAAWHPNPAAQAAFLTSCKTKLQESPAAMSLLVQDGDRVLSPEDVRYLADVLLAKQKPSPQPVRKKSTWLVSDGRMRSMAEQRRISRNVKATLNQHFLRDGKPTYSLHVICGANDSVCGSEYYCSKQEDYLSFAPCEYRYTHVNFLATEKEGCSSSPMLFFAEFDNEKDEGEPAVICCKVDMPLPFAEHVRCLYCEVEGAKVVHPALEKFHGGDKEFEEVIRGKHSLTNSRIICLNEYAVQRLYAHDEDFIRRGRWRCRGCPPGLPAQSGAQLANKIQDTQSNYSST
uniref:Uncharacterized protein n=1 Tax=Oryza barthii TaxID=65489 RepID=A0A0D3HAL5_9ORYZ